MSTTRSASNNPDRGVEVRGAEEEAWRSTGPGDVRPRYSRLAYRATVACRSKRIKTLDHVRSDLPRNFGQRAFGGPQPSGPPSGGWGPPHLGRLRGGYAASIAPEWRWLQKPRPALADARPFRPRARHSRSVFDAATTAKHRKACLVQRSARYKCAGKKHRLTTHDPARDRIKGHSAQNLKAPHVVFSSAKLMPKPLQKTSRFRLLRSHYALPPQCHFQCSGPHAEAIMLMPLFGSRCDDGKTRPAVGLLGFHMAALNWIAARPQ